MVTQIKQKTIERATIHTNSLLSICLKSQYDLASGIISYVGQYQKQLKSCGRWHTSMSISLTLWPAICGQIQKECLARITHLTGSGVISHILEDSRPVVVLQTQSLVLVVHRWPVCGSTNCSCWHKFSCRARYVMEQVLKFEFSDRG